MRAALASLRPKRPVQFGPRTFTSLTEQSGWGIVILVLLATVTTWQVALLAGGAKSVVPHLFYVPIMLAAVRFGYLGAVAAALLSGVLAGPLLPLDTAAAADQAPAAWLTRLSIFTGISLFVAWITSHTRPGLLTTGSDARLAAEIREALTAGHIGVHYQPQVDLSTGQPIGVEALVRWMHPVEGIRSPGEFVPAAERTGLIEALDTTVLRQALGQLAEWHRQGFEHLTMAVNISGCWFHDPALIDIITTALAAHDVAPHQLQLELTETSILVDSASIARQTRALRALGIKVAIDDFGAGQTSLSYLHRFSIDTIKIDREFTVYIVDEDSVSRLVGGMIRLFDTLGVRVVAEGIETADQYLLLGSLGAHTGQGYYIAQPAPATDITTWLSQRRQRAHARPPRQDHDE